MFYACVNRGTFKKELVIKKKEIFVYKKKNINKNKNKKKKREKEIT
jgi:hypothetical protein